VRYLLDTNIFIAALKGAAPVRARLAEVPAIDSGVAQQYADIRAHLERHGTPVGSNDYWIAAQARAGLRVLVLFPGTRRSRLDDLIVFLKTV
jgi:tRNA(fMet)-specific endonuclease VapC